jgi:integrase
LRKWKGSTAENNINRVNTHVVTAFGGGRVRDFRRDELQSFLDGKCSKLGFSMVDHLRWDLKQIFDMAVAEDLVRKNPALLLFTPREAKRGQRLVMTIEEVNQCFAVLEMRERLIVQLAVVAGMRPGEIFGLTWGRVGPDYADVLQRVYRGQIDLPKTVPSIRQAALSDGLLRSLDRWRALCIDTRPEAWVFSSERGTPLSRDNVLRRGILPKLASVRLSWVNFQVMRRTHSTLMNNMGVEGKLVADQLGHSLDVNQNVYTKSPVERRKAIVDQLERSLIMYPRRGNLWVTSGFSAGVASGSGEVFGRWRQRSAAPRQRRCESADHRPRGPRYGEAGRQSCFSAKSCSGDGG